MESVSHVWTGPRAGFGQDIIMFVPSFVLFSWSIIGSNEKIEGFFVIAGMANKQHK